MRVLLPLPIVLPLVAAALSILCGRLRSVQRLLGVGTLVALVVIALVIAIGVDRDGPAAVQAGNWAAPVGITLVADRLTAIMLLTASIVLLAVLLYAIGQPGAERNHVGFQSVYLVLAAGVSAAFLAGDLFNLFVALEMMLTASYVLMTLGGRLDQVRSGMTYVVVSIVASGLFLFALALTYAAAGTVNLADLSGRIAELSPGVQAMLAGLLFVVFGIKAAIVPLYFWLPDSYPTAPTAVTAIFAGLLTKVGMYAIIRTQTLLFAPSVRPATLILVIAGLTMAVGVVGAIAQQDIKRILSFHIIGQIGYMVMGLGLFTVAGLAATVFSFAHHIVVMTTLFLAGGLIEHVGRSSRLARLGHLVRTAPVVAVAFALPALSLAGIPPFSGFVAKFALFDATARQRQWAVLATAIAVSFLTVFSIFKVWVGAFWGEPTEDLQGRSLEEGVLSTAETEAVARRRAPWLMVLPTAVLGVAGLVIGLAAAPLYRLSERAAVDLLDTEAYITAVLDP